MSCFYNVGHDQYFLCFLYFKILETMVNYWPNWTCNILVIYSCIFVSPQIEGLTWNINRHIFVLKEVRILHNLHSNSTNAKSQNKATLYILIHIYLYLTFFMVTFFTLLNFWLLYTFLYEIFLRNSKYPWKHVFIKYYRILFNVSFLRWAFI